MSACMPSLEKFAVWLHIDKRGIKYLTVNTTPSACICEVHCLCFIYMKAARFFIEASLNYITTNDVIFICLTSCFEGAFRSFFMGILGGISAQKQGRMMYQLTLLGTQTSTKIMISIEGTHSSTCIQLQFG